MSQASKTLNAIKTALGMEVKLAQMKLEDGVTVIEAETFEAGQAVVIVTEDDQKIALPEGEYVLEDGMVLKVEEEGIIASIGEREEVEKEKEKDEEDKEKMKYEDKEELASEAKTPKKIVEAVTKESYFSSDDLKTIADLIDSKLVEFKNELNLSKEDTVKETEETVELNTEEPAANPITHNPENETIENIVKYGENRQRTTIDRVMDRISKI